MSSFIRAPAEEFISGLLQRPLLGSVIAKTAADADAVVTGGVVQDINIDMQKVTPFVDSLVTAIDPQLAANFTNAPIPGPIKIITSGELPKIRQVAKILPWLWPLTALGSFALFALAYWQAQNWRETVLYIGLAVVITGFIGLLFIPAIRLAVENNVSNPSVQLIVSAVMAVFIRDYFFQTIILIVIGVVVIVARRFLAKAEDDLPVTADNLPVTSD